MKRLITFCIYISCLNQLVAQVPTITDFNPKTGAPGSVVTITGTNFSTTSASDIVFFGATRATVTAATATQLTVTVPNGATVSPVSVTVNNLTGLSSAAFIPAFRLNRGNLQPDVNFYSQQSISVPPISPIIPALSDFDGDGKTDIVYTSYTLGNIYLNRNTSTGQQVSFAPFVTLSSGTSSTLSFLKIADIDGDNKPDIISCTINTVFIWKNKSTAGSILFDSPVSIALDSRINGVRGLEISDFNKDGKIDILTANSYRQTPTDPQRGIFSLLRNTSSGSTISFGANTYITGTSIPSFIALADVEQDNQTEIVVYYTLIDGSNSSEPIIGYALRVEKIVFSGNNFSFNGGKEILTSLTTVTDLKAADINGDNKPEILISDIIGSGGTIANARTIIFNNTSVTGNIAFNSVLDLRVQLADPRFLVSQLAATDIDGDGKLDILITIDGNSFVGFLYNRSTLNNFSFLAGDNLLTGITLQNPIAGDLNNDNKPEIITGLSGRNLNGTLPVILNSTYTQPTIQSISPTKGNLFSTINISGSNFSSIASENVVTIGNVKGIVQNATPNQLLVSVPAGADYQPITVNVAQQSGYAFQPYWITFPNDGNLTSSSFTTDATLARDILGIASKESVIMADIDSDGKTDIVAASNTAIFGPLSIVNVFRNTSNNTTVSFQAKTEYEVGQDIRKMLVTDLNNDTKPEILTLNTTAKTISILRNTSTTGSISFAPKTDLPFDGSFGLGIAVGDLNLDGKPDIAYTSSTDNGIVLMINNSTVNNLTFTKSTIVLGQNNPNVELAIYDIDGDNKPEVITNGYGLGLIIFRNTSTGGTLNFASGIIFTPPPIGPLPRLAVADLNADNKPDIITANGSSIRLFPNTSTRGNISLGSPTDLTITGTTNSPTSIAITDIDGNGKPDLIFDDGICIFRNQSNDGGNLSFSNLLRFIPNGILASVADINADGKPDFIIRNTYNIGSGAPDQNNISYLRNIAFPALPTLQSVSPATGSGPGRTITLTGTNLTEVLSITFAGVNQPVFSGNPDFTQLTAIVPDGATSGNLVVTTRGGTASIPFTAIDPASFITGNSTVCPAQKNLVYSVPAVSGASAYEWTVPAGITIVKGNNTNTITANLDNPFTGVGTIRVRGTYGSFKGENSPTFNVSVATIPAVPANLQAKIASSGTVALSWEDKSSDETEFFIYRATNIDTAFVLLGKAASNLTGFTDNFDLKSGTTYFYKIAAANGECLSAFSNIVGVTTPPPVITALSEPSEKNIIISPNPSDGIFEIVSERALTPKTELFVRDALGKVVWQSIVKVSESGRYALKLQDIASGIYFLTIKTERSSITKKIIRQ